LINISWVYGLLYLASTISSKILISYLVIDNNNFFDNINNLYVIWWFHILYLFMVIIYVWVYLWLIKTISDIYKWISYNFYSNINYWFGNIINSFATYYYIFMYVYFIPAIFMILWLWLILIDLINNKIWAKTINWWYLNWTKIPDFSNVQWFYFGLWLVLLSIIIWIYFVIYRWIKSSFAIIHSVDTRDFSYNSFKLSIKFTNNNWWRIFWNMFIFFIITWIIFWILNSIFSLFNWYIYSSWIDYSKIKDFDPIMIKNIINSLFNTDIGSFLQNALSWLQVYIWIVFMYILYKNLEKKDWWQVWIENWSQDILKQGYTSLWTEDL